MWCENCRKDFESNDGVCPDCGSKPEELVLAATANDEIEADIITAKLTAAGIPVLPRYRESGDFLKVFMGNSCFGVDLYVPASVKEDAFQILQATEITPEDIKTEDAEATETAVKSDQKNMVLLVIGVLAVLLLFSFLLSKLL
jgi:hypothetical protein